MHVEFDLNCRLEIAEANPHKFRLDYGELETRKQFIRDTRSVIKVRAEQGPPQGGPLMTGASPGG